MYKHAAAAEKAAESAKENTASIFEKLGLKNALNWEHILAAVIALIVCVIAIRIIMRILRRIVERSKLSGSLGNFLLKFLCSFLTGHCICILLNFLTHLNTPYGSILFYINHPELSSYS